MRVRFLSHDEAVREFDSSYYLHSHSPAEISLKLSRYCNDSSKQLLQCYSSKIRPFSNDEKHLLKFYFKRVYAHLCRKAPWLLPNKRKVGLIRLDHGVDWNAPFTINHSIVIPERVLRLMAAGYKKYKCIGRSSSAKHCVTTLCHEFIHIIQRYPELYPYQASIFNRMYKKWGFIQIQSSQLDWSQVDMTKFLPLRTNPDGLNFQWLFPLRGTLYMPIFGEIGGDEKTMGQMGGALVRVIQNDDKFIVTNDWDYTKNFKDYLQLFYNRDEQLYHPNEIIAIYLCDVFMYCTAINIKACREKRSGFAIRILH